MSKKKNKNKNKQSTNSTQPLQQNDEIQNSTSPPSRHNPIPPQRSDPEGSRDTDTANNILQKQQQQQPDGMQNFYAELPPAENSNSTSSEDWHSGHEESYAAEVRVRTLLGRLDCDGAEPSSVREQDIFRILELNEVTDVEALYKTSKERFVLILGSEDSASKCRSMELSYASGDARVSLLFRERKRASTFVTIFCPEYISCRAVELAFSNFGEVDRVFYGTHKFNRNIRNGKRHVRIFPTGGSPNVLPRKVTFPEGISRDVLYKGKLVDCHRCSTCLGLGEGCTEVVGKEPDEVLQEQLNSPRDHTPSPSETPATDDTSTVVDEHREIETESNHESVPNQSDPEAEISDSPSLEEGEIESDCTSNLQESDKDSPPRKLRSFFKQGNPFKNLPEPKPEHFDSNVFSPGFRIRRYDQQLIFTEMVEHYEVQEQCRFHAAFYSAMELMHIWSMPKYFSILEKNCKDFNFNYGWNLSVPEYEAHMVNIVNLCHDFLG